MNWSFNEKTMREGCKSSKKSNKVMTMVLVLEEEVMLSRWEDQTARVIILL